MPRSLLFAFALTLACNSDSPDTTDSGASTSQEETGVGPTSTDLPLDDSTSADPASTTEPTDESGLATTSTDAESSTGPVEEGENAYVSCDGGCPDGFSPVGVAGTPCVCLPSCDPGEPMCPPSPVATADAICWDTFVGGYRCGLACPAPGEDDACPQGMVCLAFSGNMQLGGCLAPGCPTCMWP